MHKRTVPSIYPNIKPSQVTNWLQKNKQLSEALSMGFISNTLLRKTTVWASIVNNVQTHYLVMKL